MIEKFQRARDARPYAPWKKIPRPFTPLWFESYIPRLRAITVQPGHVLVLCAAPQTDRRRLRKALAKELTFVKLPGITFEVRCHR